MTDLLAALPVLLATLLLVGLRWPASRAMPVCALMTALAAWGRWKIPGLQLAAAGVEAVTITLSVLLILFGALFLVEQLRAVGAIRSLQWWLGRQSPDARVQVLLVAWLLGSFFEGASGFGAPPAITAPLLLALGVQPVLAVVLALVGDSVAVSFGAVGTPLLVGMKQGLVGAPGEVPQPELIAQRIAIADVLIGSLVPALLVLTFTMGVQGRRGFKPGLRAVPLALAIGFSHLATAAVVAVWVGPELPSILGPLCGMIVAAGLLRRGWLVPRDAFVMGNADGAPSTQAHTLGEGTVERADVARAVLPYVVLVVLLAVTRAGTLGIGDVLRGVTVGWNDVFSTGIRAQVQPLFSPGAVFVVVTSLVPVLYGASWKSLGPSAHGAWRKLSLAAVPLLAAVVTVRIFVHSGNGLSGLPPMPMVLADLAAQSAGGIWPLLAPWVGALGSFISGSATFSNLLFAGIQQSVAHAHAHDAASVLALQGMGAAAGNMICVHNVVAASAVVGLRRREGDVIRRTAPAMVVYLLLASVLGALRMS